MMLIHTFYYDVKMDLCNDLENIAAAILIQRGSEKNIVRQLRNPLKVLIEHDMLHITPYKREVVYSKEFYCPEDYKKALKELVDKIKNGEDINYFLSNSKDKIESHDLLLFDWGIYHLHLTRQYNKNGQPKRSNYLLFVRCTEQKMYFIQIYSHHSNPFCREELQRIVINNWPELAGPINPIKGSLSEKITDSARKVLRENHVSTLYELDGKLYFPPGGGYMSDGSSLLAVRRADFYWNTVKEIEQWLLLNINNICKAISNLIALNDFKENLCFKLHSISRTNISLLELSNLVKIKYNFQSDTCKIILLWNPEEMNSIINNVVSNWIDMILSRYLGRAVE